MKQWLTWGLDKRGSLAGWKVLHAETRLWTKQSERLWVCVRHQEEDPAGNESQSAADSLCGDEPMMMSRWP